MGIVIGIIIVGIILWLISSYNKMVRSREMVRNSMGQIATQIESRWDALKSLMDATKKYSEYEASVLYDITANRTSVNRNSDVNSVDKDDSTFKEALNKLNIVVENYPDLKASGVYENTMDKIDTYENNVRQSRMIYNDTVTKYNRSILVFPASIVAKMFSFTEESYFESTSSKGEMPSWD